MSNSIIGLEISPVNKLTFKPPMPFTAGVHGPGSFGTSLSYPSPATITGMLSSIIYRNGSCNKLNNIDNIKPEDPFADTLACLEEFIGESFEIYTGFLSRGNKLYAYVNKDIFPELSILISALNNNCLKQTDIIKALRIRQTGISLDRNTKKVQEGLLYSIESILYKPHAKIKIFIKTSQRTLDVKRDVVKLGSKSGLTIISVIESDEITYSKIETGEYIGVLVSPAILQDNPFTQGSIIVSSKETLSKILSELMSLSSIKGTGSLLKVPKGEYEFSTYTLGWSLKFNRIRPPKLIIPPGTCFKLHIKQGTHLPYLNKYNIYLARIGAWSNLGWGTTLLYKSSNS